MRSLLVRGFTSLVLAFKRLASYVDDRLQRGVNGLLIWAIRRGSSKERVFAIVSAIHGLGVLGQFIAAGIEKPWGDRLALVFCGLVFGFLSHQADRGMVESVFRLQHTAYVKLFLRRQKVFGWVGMLIATPIIVLIPPPMTIYILLAVGTYCLLPYVLSGPDEAPPEEATDAVPEAA